MYRACDVTSVTLNDDDEWRGTTDPEVRRRVQNRLNQRAYRLRRRQMLGIPKKPRRAADKTAHTLCTSSSQPSDRIEPDFASSCHTAVDTVSGKEHTGDRSNFSQGQLQARHGDSDSTNSVASDTCTELIPWYTNKAAVFAQFQRLGLGRHIGRLPSNDHLLCVMQFNTMRAFGTISSIVGLSPANLADDNASSPFFTYTPAHSQQLLANSIPQACLPKSLAPTALQRSTPHHPWFDILPFPQMRDNLLRLESHTSTTPGQRHYDADSLCHWMVGLATDQKQAGLILWGDPWDMASWEVTADFFQRWGWTLEGCVELFRSTNYWRAKRGEKPLFSIENL